MTINKKNNNNIWVWICISPFLIYLLFVFVPYGITFFTKGGPWSGRIIDIETKKPIDGAVVLAVWEISHMSPGGGVDRFHRAYEAITDERGFFEVPKYAIINPLPIIQLAQKPYFAIYKPGYLAIPRIGGDFLLPESSTKLNKGNILLKEKTYQYYFAAGLIELPKLKSVADSKKQFRSPYIPKKHMPNFLKLLNQTALEIGLEPYPLEGGER